MGQIADNLVKVRARIADAARRAGRGPDEVRLVGVTKTVPVPLIHEAFEAGVQWFGENRIQEAAQKAAQLDGEGIRPRWHMVGHLQRNKVRRVFGLFELIHSVDSLPLIETLARCIQAEGAEMDVLLQVNVAGESGKCGCRPGEVPALAKALKGFPHLQLRGLMTIPPFPKRPEESRPWFQALRKLRDNLVDKGFSEVQELSMGMTADFEVAIEEGATWVRVGTAIFGPRE
jgi:hypothetical protein